MHWKSPRPIFSSARCQQPHVLRAVGGFAAQEAEKQPAIFSAVFVFLFYLEAVKRYEKPQDVIGTLKNSEDSQVPHDPLHTSILYRENGAQCFRKCI